MRTIQDPAATSGARVLVVDDDPLVRNFLRIILTQAGYRVLTAASGLNALRQLETAPLPDLVLLDLRMPELDGAGFRRAQCRSSRLFHIPVVVCSGEDPEFHRMEFSGCGWVRKPVDVSELLSTVAASLRQRDCAVESSRPLRLAADTRAPEVPPHQRED